MRPILIPRAECVAGESFASYTRAVERAGGEARALPLREFAPAAIPEGSGVLLTAGVDVDPARYGESRSQRVRAIDPARDAFEESLLAWAFARDLPVLAICRGHQLLNTWRGGRLLQHLPDREPHRARRADDGEAIASGWHDVDVAADTLLARIVEVPRLRVNSRHHQAVPVSGVAPGLVMAATGPGGVVEALWDPAQRFALSVQWHPEYPEIADDPALAPYSARLFEAFVRAAR